MIFCPEILHIFWSFNIADLWTITDSSLAKLSMTLSDYHGVTIIMSQRHMMILKFEKKNTV